jgi:outer membrane protein assembly factor BamA
MALMALLPALPAAAGGGNSGLILLPFPIYSPETRAAITFTALYHARSAEAPAEVPPSMAMLSLAYSQDDQKRAALSPELYLAGGRWLVRGEAAYEDWPDKFWGIGNDTPEAAEEDYTSRNLIGSLGIERRLPASWWAGLLLEYSDYRMTETESRGALAAGGVTGAGGATVAGVGVVLRRDTRDDVNFPRSGGLLKVTASGFGSALGGDVTFERYTGDARAFLGLGGAHVLALQAYTHVTRGDVPFQRLARIGVASGISIMRGYRDGRFRDRVSTLGQAEYRFPLLGRLGGVAFAAAGEVAPALTDLHAGGVKWTGGGGLRYRASDSEPINLRLDVGVGAEGAAVYFNIFEAF